MAARNAISSRTYKLGKGPLYAFDTRYYRRPFQLPGLAANT
ncbi:MAG TPA: hypothetical protein VMD08_13135 [Candidatus Baltobacteraceae bacterium]|nr:hypothetical protein [Candidatus Baltobacteraceae bacterium]